MVSANYFVVKISATSGMFNTKDIDLWMHKKNKKIIHLINHGLGIIKKN